MTMDSKEIRQLAKDVCEGKVFGTWNISEGETNNIPLVFIPIALMEKGSIPEGAVHVYEYFDKAGPRSINGMPIFFSCHFLFKEDAELLLKLIRAYQKKQAEFMEGDIPEENAHNVVNTMTVGIEEDGEPIRDSSEE